MGLGIVFVDGCVLIDDGCVQTNFCVSNTDPCLDICCQLLIAATTVVPPDFVLINNAFTASAFSVALNQFDYHSCPGSGELVATNSRWEWTLPTFAGGVTITAPLFTCPPVDADNATKSLWEGASTILVTGVHCCLPATRPDTNGTLVVVGLLGNFTTGGGTSSPMNPVWGGSLVYDISTTDNWVAPNATITGFLAIPMGGGMFVDFAVPSLTISEDLNGCQDITLVFGGLLQTAYKRRGGEWPGRLWLANNAQMIGGPISLPIGYL